jgi:hypothetical protein
VRRSLKQAILSTPMLLKKAAMLVPKPIRNKMIHLRKKYFDIV